MEFQSLCKHAIIAIVGSIFLLIITSRPVDAKDNKSSPLYRESLQEIVKEYNSGTKKFMKKPEPDQKKAKKGQCPIKKVGHEPKEHHNYRPISRPTLRGSTCRGVRCYGFPTLVGSTCSVTCGVRSTCSNGWFCRQNPSPCAGMDNPNRLAKGNEKSFAFTIF